MILSGGEGMKNFLSIALIIAAVILVGCGGEKRADISYGSNEKVAAILQKDSLWVMDSKNVPYLNDAIARKDVEYLEQLMIEGKVFLADKDTKVTRFGLAADKNIVMILFKEGRYTNKTGCTHASNVLTEKEYSEYLENRKKAALSLVQHCLISTENYSGIILSGNEEGIKQLKDVCFANRNTLGRQMENYDSNIAQCMKDAADINFERYNALFYCIQSIESKNNVSRDHYKKEVNSSCNKAEQLRQNFRNKYGY